MPDREEKPMIPPPRKAVSEFLTPVPTVVFFSEVVNRDDPSYGENAPVKRGTLYSTIKGATQAVIDAYPNLYFVKESKLGRSDQWVIWTWATVPNAEDSYNAEIDYVSEAVAAPRFSRVYTLRRDDYEASPTINPGTPLKGLVAIKVTAGGTGYRATDTVNIAGPGSGAVASLVLDSNGTIKSVLVSAEGGGYTTAAITITTATGSGATLVGIIQTQSAVLVSQKKQEFPDDHPLRNEFVRVIRVYETLPGPFIETTTIDEYGNIVIKKTRRNIAANITSGEVISGGFWTETTKEQVDDFVGNEVLAVTPIPGAFAATTRIDSDGVVVTVNTRLNAIASITSGETLSGGVWTKTTKKEISDLVAQEIVEARAIPGNPMESDRVDEDGVKISVVRTMESAATIAAITPRETLVTGVWTRITSEEISDLVAWKVVETRTVPGNPLVDTKIDEDGKTIATTKTLKDASAITSSESVSGGNWTRTFKERVSDLVAYEVTEVRPIPGNPIPSTKLADDGIEIDTVRTLKDQSTITTGETLAAGIWTKKTKEQVTDLVAWEVVEARAVPGNAIPSAKVAGDDQVATVASTLKASSAITPSASESGGIITTVEKKEVSDLVSEEIVTTKRWLDTAEYSISIADVIPEVFRAQIPTTTTVHILAGTASMPTLGTHEFERTEKQQTKLLFSRTIVALSAPTLPVVVTNKGLTTRFGGATTTITLTLNTHGTLTIDTGKMVLSSKIDDLGNGDDVKISEVGDGTDWPLLNSTHVDDRYGIVIPITKQVVAAGATGGVSGGVYTEVRSLDKWRSITIASRLDATSLPSSVQWFSGQRHSFPPELTDAIIEWAEATCGCSDSFSAMLQANMKQYTGMVKARMTEQFYNGVPPDDVTITQFFPQSHNFGWAWASSCGSTSGDCRTKSGAPLFHIPLCLHGALSLSVGLAASWTFAATTPAALPHGSYIMLPPHVERWRFGVFRRVLTEVLVP